MDGITLAAVAVAVTALLARAARRRRARSAPVASRGGPLRAGVKHLASTVSDLSDLELRLSAVRRAPNPRGGWGRRGSRA